MIGNGMIGNGMIRNGMIGNGMIGNGMIGNGMVIYMSKNGFLLLTNFPFAINPLSLF